MFYIRQDRYGLPSYQRQYQSRRNLVESVLGDNIEELYNERDILDYPQSYNIDDKDIDCSEMYLIHWAAYANSIDCFIYLYQKGCNMFLKTSSGLTPLHYAIHCNSELVLAFIFREISKNISLQKDLLEIYEKSYKLKEADIKKNIIYLTIMDGSAFCLQKLFDLGYNLEKCQTPKFKEEIIKKCISKHKADCLAILLKYTSSKSHDLLSKTPVMLAAEQNNLEGLKLLLESGFKADVCTVNSSNEYNNALTVATFLYTPNPQVVSLLLDHIYDLRSLEQNGHDTAAHCAIQSRNLEIATMILERTHDVKTLNKHGKSPAHHLLLWRNQDDAVKVMKILIEKGFDVNTTFPNHESFLGECLKAISQNFKLIDFLLQNKADVNAKMYKKDVPYTTCKEFILQRIQNPNFKQIIDKHPEIFS